VASARVAETWDGYLNDINGGDVTVETGIQALEVATSGPIEEGSVGGGFLAFSTANPGAFTPGFRTLYPREGCYDELRFIPLGLP
jgi:L-aminopeptidase/D-esterase-like protein